MTTTATTATEEKAMRRLPSSEHFPILKALTALVKHLADKLGGRPMFIKLPYHTNLTFLMGTETRAVVQKMDTNERFKTSSFIVNMTSDDSNSYRG
jgi:hypothetical protein